MMTDLALGGGWLAVLGAGIAGCLVVRRLGLPTTYVRDLLHVGAGIWVIGWPWWDGAAIPIAIVAAVAAGTLILPLIAARCSIAGAIVRSVTNSDEAWGGLVLYTISYTGLTAAGMLIDPFPAAAAALALSYGDGIGGLVGRTCGRHQFRAPGGKRKTVEGSIVVGLVATVGVITAAAILDHDLSFALAFGLGQLAAVVEALSPRGTDNLFVPAAVWTAATVLT